MQSTYQPQPPSTPDMDDSSMMSDNRDVKLPPAALGQHGFMYPLNYHKAHLDASMM